MSNVFVHSGDLGDVIWSLPTIRATGCGSLVLCPSALTNKQMDKELAYSLKSLLEKQSYISSVEFYDSPPIRRYVDLNKFRLFLSQGANLADAHLLSANYPVEYRNTRWLDVPRESVSPILFSKSPRYENPIFPWREAYEKYHRGASFVGLPEEHSAFESKYGKMHFVPTKDLYELAKVINGASLIVCGQGCPHAIAEGLKKRIVLAADPQYPFRCWFPRIGVVTCLWTAPELPEEW